MDDPERRIYTSFIGQASELGIQTARSKTWDPHSFKPDEHSKFWFGLSKLTKFKFERFAHKTVLSIFVNWIGSFPSTSQQLYYFFLLQDPSWTWYYEEPVQTQAFFNPGQNQSKRSSS